MRNGFSLRKTRCEWTPDPPASGISREIRWPSRDRCTHGGLDFYGVKIYDVAEMASSPAFLRPTVETAFPPVKTHGSALRRVFGSVVLLSETCFMRRVHYLTEGHGTLAVHLDKRAPKILAGENFHFRDTCNAQRLVSQRQGWGMFRRPQPMRARMLLVGEHCRSLNGACPQARFSA